MHNAFISFQRRVSGAIYQIIYLLLRFLIGRCINCPNNQNVRFVSIILHFQCKRSCLSHHKYLLAALVEMTSITSGFSSLWSQLSAGNALPCLHFSPTVLSCLLVSIGQAKRHQRLVLSTLLCASLSASCQVACQTEIWSSQDICEHDLHLELAKTIGPCGICSHVSKRQDLGFLLTYPAKNHIT